MNFKNIINSRVCGSCGENERDCECWHGGTYDRLNNEEKIIKENNVIYEY